jgi:hypothetical protein
MQISNQHHNKDVQKERMSAFAGLDFAINISSSDAETERISAAYKSFPVILSHR